MDNLRKYIGIPYEFGGRDFDGIDCFGLVKIFYENEFNIILPDYPENLNITSLEEVRNSDYFIGNICNQFHQIDEDERKLGDVILFMINSTTPNHIGVVVDKFNFLNVNDRQSTHIAKIAKWKKFIVGFYRFNWGV
jgi:cell wall-associated NlpC family hydrolase